MMYDHVLNVRLRAYLNCCHVGMHYEFTKGWHRKPKNLYQMPRWYFICVYAVRCTTNLFVIYVWHELCSIYDTHLLCDFLRCAKSKRQYFNKTLFIHLCTRGDTHPKTHFATSLRNHNNKQTCHPRFFSFW